MATGALAIAAGCKAARPPPPVVVIVDAGVVAIDAGGVVVDAGVAVDAAAGPPPGWIDLAVAIPDAVLDLRYATANNLTGAPLYPVARCWLRADPAARLVAAAAALRARGHRLVLWDCYRPASIQHALWARVPDPRFVAPPRDDADGRPIAGSVHSRGAAVDVSLADRDGHLRAMPTDHDVFTADASGGRARGPARAYLRDLRAAMAGAGFTALASEWWHFDARGGAPAPLVDLPLR